MSQDKLDKKRRQDRNRQRKFRASLSEEQKKELYARRIEKRSAERAVIALAEGRVPGKCGPKAFSEEQKKIADKKRHDKWRNKDLVRTRSIEATIARNRRAKKRSVGGKHTAKDIAELLKKQKGNCAWCLLSLGKDKYHVDHYMPIRLRGSNDKGNLRILHARCNLKKSGKHPAEFAQQNGLLCW